MSKESLKIENETEEEEGEKSASSFLSKVQSANSSKFPSNSSAASQSRETLNHSSKRTSSDSLYHQKSPGIKCTNII